MRGKAAGRGQQGRERSVGSGTSDVGASQYISGLLGKV